MDIDVSKPADPFDPVRETAAARIEIKERADGGKEFILPATRNFSEKCSFTVGLLFITGFLALFAFFFTSIVREFPPGVIQFFFLNHVLYALGFLALIELLMILAVADMWLRSSRIIAIPGQLQSVTHWLFFKRAATVSSDRILEIKVEQKSSAGVDVYYAVVVLTLGSKPGWIAKNFPMRGEPNDSFTERDIKSFNSGGKRLSVATDIKGKAEADWLADELCLALGLDERIPSSNNLQSGSPASTAQQ